MLRGGNVAPVLAGRKELRMRAIVTAALIGLGFVAGPASAAPVDAAVAKAMIYPATGMVFYPVEPNGLDTDAMEKVGRLQDAMPGQMAAFEQGGYGYYGAMAVPMGRPLGPESLVMVAGLHSPAAAQQSVLAQCKAMNSTECTVIGFTLPNGYRKQGLSLSATASAGMADFGKGRGPHYLAYSPSTASFAVAKGTGADAVALQTCNEATGGHNDCVIGVVEE
jgi:hypothetical protein